MPFGPSLFAWSLPLLIVMMRIEKNEPCAAFLVIVSCFWEPEQALFSNPDIDKISSCFSTGINESFVLENPSTHSLVTWKINQISSFFSTGINGPWLIPKATTYTTFTYVLRTRRFYVGWNARSLCSHNFQFKNLWSLPYSGVRVTR